MKVHVPVFVTCQYVELAYIIAAMAPRLGKDTIYYSAKQVDTTQYSTNFDMNKYYLWYTTKGSKNSTAKNSCLPFLTMCKSNYM